MRLYIKRDKNEVLNSIYKKNKTVEVIGEYKTMKTPIMVKCRSCGNEWNANIYHLLYGSSCPVCANKTKKKKHTVTQESFTHEMSSINSNIDILGTYVSAKTKILCKCKVCGNEWTPLPYNLLQGCGCPRCARDKIVVSQLKDQMAFEEDVKRYAKDVIPIDSYKGNHTAIRFKCAKCSGIWRATPANIIRRNNPGGGTGCPICRQSHGERAISNILAKLGIEFETQKKFDTLRGKRCSKMPFDFYLPEYNSLIEYQGQYHDGTCQLQTDEEYVDLQMRDKKKKKWADENGFNLIYIWYYDDINEIIERTIINNKSRNDHSDVGNYTRMRPLVKQDEDMI